MSTIVPRILNIPVWGSTVYGVARGDWCGVDASGNDLVIPGMKLVTGAAGVDGGFVTSTNPLPMTANRYSGGKTTSGTLATASGDNVILTPATGKTLTLFWIFLTSSQSNPAEVLAKVKLGTRVVYEAYLGLPGQFGHWEPCIADASNDELIVNLSAVGNVAVSYTVTEA